MKSIINKAICALIAGQALAVGAAQTTTLNQMTCGGHDVLIALARMIQSTNKLSSDLNFDFDTVVTKHRVEKAGLLDLRCEAQLKLIRQEDLQVVDALGVAYQLKSNGKVGYTLSFEPVR